MRLRERSLEARLVGDVLVGVAALGLWVGGPAGADGDSKVGAQGHLARGTQAQMPEAVNRSPAERRGSDGTARRGPSVRGAAFTTFNAHVDGSGKDVCQNSAINCNLYGAKEYVWLNGGPTANGLAPDGEYFFAVLVPGGQPDPNDGGAKNLSDDFDCYLNRTFTVTDGEVSWYSGADGACPADLPLQEPHWLDSGHGGPKPNWDPPFIRLFPYADTTNPGGEHIMAICSLEGGYPVGPRDCKYDAFKVKKGKKGKGDFSFTLKGMKFEDLHADGAKDATDPGLEGWTINISGFGPDGEPLSAQVTTGGGGYWEYESPVYTFKGKDKPLDVSVTVCEELEAGWTQSYPLEACHIFSFTPTGRDSFSNLDFGNWRPGRLDVSKVVDLAGLPNPGESFEICIAGPSPSTSIQCQTIGPDGGTLAFENLVAGQYTVSETDPGAAWTVTIAPAGGVVVVPAGGASSATVTNTLAAVGGGGTLDVLKRVDWNGETPQDVSFSICVAGPSFPDAPGSCQAVSFVSGDFVGGVGEKTVSWADLATGDYTISENPGAGWTATIAPIPVTVVDGQTANGTVTNTRNRGRLEVTKTVSWGVTPPSDVTFEICIVGPLPQQFLSCQFVTLLVGDTQETVAWSAPPGDYQVTETDPGAEWIVDVPPDPVLVTVGQTSSAGVLNVRMSN